jgi:hypothetical protein
MKLLTNGIKTILPALYSQEGVDDPPVVLKFFCPWNQWTWYVTEGSEVCGECSRYDCTDPAHAMRPKYWLFFGLVRGHEVELGYFSLRELEEVRGPSGLRIERDLYWKPKPLSEVRATLQ